MIEIDETGKNQVEGRIYVIIRICFQESIKEKRLEKALKAELSEIIINELKEKFNLSEQNKNNH